MFDTGTGGVAQLPYPGKQSQKFLALEKILHATLLQKFQKFPLMKTQWTVMDMIHQY